MKIDLALKPDFTLMDSFRAIDWEGRGFFDVATLRDALDKMRLYPSLEEAQLLVNRFEGRGGGRVRYSEYCEAITPKSAEYAALLNGRAAFGGGLNAMTGETRDQLRRTWQTFMRVEIAAESLRQRLDRMPMFSPIEAF